MVDCEDEEQWNGHEALWQRPLQSEGDTWSVIQVARGESLKGISPFDFSGIVFTGSHHGVLDDLPWMRDTADFMRLAVTGPIPEGASRPGIVAVCFGAQLLAHALGGKAGPNPSGQFVYTAEKVAGTEALQQHAAWVTADHTHSVQEGEGVSYCLLETHGDCVLALPPGATLLAASSSCAHEVFCIGKNGECHKHGRPPWVRHPPPRPSIHSRGAARASRVQRG